MNHTPAPPSRSLTLPEEFVLLSHLDSGKVHGCARAVIGCAAAELGELALRRRLLVRSRKSRVFGFEAYRLHGIKIELLDTSPTGLAWADDVLSGLEQRSTSGSEHGRVSLNWWFRRRKQAFRLHRASLTERGVLRREPSSFLTGERHYPDPVARGMLSRDVRAAGGEHGRLDAHMLFLCDLVEAVGLSRQLGFELSLRNRLDRARGVGAASLLSEELRDTSTAVTSLVPTHDNDARYGRIRRI